MGSENINASDMKKMIWMVCAVWGLSGCSATVKAFPVQERRVVVVERRKHRKPGKVVIVGTRIKQRPAKSVVIYYKDVSYLYADGVYYRPVDNDYEVIKPHIGMVVPELPEDGVQKIRIKDDIFYSYDDVLYKKISTRNGIQYEVQGFINE